MKQYPKVFDPLYSNMVEAGETGGILDTILQRLSTYIEKNVKLQAAVKSALIYPIGVLSIAAGVIVLAVVEGRADFRDVVRRLGRGSAVADEDRYRVEQLRGKYLRLVDSSWPWWLESSASRSGTATVQGSYIIDSIILKLPVLGILMRKIAVARFTRTLGTLISSGVPILEGLDITAKTSGNAVVEKALFAVRKALEEGKSLTEPLKESQVFPGMVTQMIAVGEQTGAMDAMLQKIADFYEDEVDAAVKDLLTALEPIMIVFLGVVVGGVVISMYLPLFTLIGKLSGH